MEIICPNCQQKQIDHKLPYCSFCYCSFAPDNPQKEASLSLKKRTARFNDLSVSTTLLLTDDGKIITLALKPLGQIIFDNLVLILFFELLLVPLLIAFNGVLEVVILVLFRLRISFLYLFILTFIGIHVLKFYPLFKGNTFRFDVLKGEYSCRHKAKVQTGKISDIKNITVSKWSKTVPRGRYSREYTLTTWEVSVQLKSGGKIILHQFANKDDGQLSRRLAMSWNSTDVLFNNMEKGDDHSFWADTGQEVRNFVMPLSQRLDLEVVYVS